VLRWIENWLSNRKQRVCVNGYQSSWQFVLSRDSIPGLPFPGHPGFPDFFHSGIPGNENASFPEKSGNESRYIWSINETPGSDSSAFKRQLLVSYQLPQAVPSSSVVHRPHSVDGCCLQDSWLSPDPCLRRRSPDSRLATCLSRPWYSNGIAEPDTAASQWQSPTAAATAVNEHLSLTRPSHLPYIVQSG